MRTENNFDMTFDELYLKARKKIALIYFEKFGADIPMSYLKGRLDIFVDNHGREAMIDLYGWWLYCQGDDVPSHLLWTHLAHDLSHGESSNILPRTHGYGGRMFNYKKESNDNKNENDIS